MSFLGAIVRRLKGRAGQGESEHAQDAEETLERFQTVLGISFSNKDLLRQALTHRSAVSGDNAHGSDLQSNERLEFLGDSVLSLIVNEHLYHEYPKHREGLLTQMKSLLVSRAVLSVKAREMRLGEFLFLSPGEEESGGRDRSSILADSFEAITGAIYLDQGMDAARDFIERRLMADAKRILADTNNINYKSMLQEYIQSEKKVHPQYKVASEAGPDHEKTFTVEVTVGKRVLGRGKGRNKKQAQQEAAKAALKALDLLPEEPGENGLEIRNLARTRGAGNAVAGEGAHRRGSRSVRSWEGRARGGGGRPR